MKFKVVISTVIFILVLSFSSVLADVPQMINYQGKLTTPSGALVDDTVSMVFTIYDDSTGVTALWTETQDSVRVEYGIFSVLLGSVSSIPDSVFDGDVRYLGVKVGNDSEMTPRKAIVSVGYAYKSEYADTSKYAEVAVSDSDWTIDGNNIYRFNGYVGIGTVLPDRQLHLSGTSRGDGLRIDAQWDPTIYMKAGVADQQYRLIVGDDQGFYITDDRLEYSPIVIKSGNVGIGMANPSAKLSLGSNIANTKLAIGDDGYGSIYGIGLQASELRFHLAAPTGTARFAFFDAPGGSELMRIQDNGNVGIGTSSPAYKLDVNGDINVAGSYNVKRGGVNYNHPDYVFESDYKLMSLEQLKKYVFEHKSLPNVISADDVRKNNGFKMDELLIQMLEKLEEQTLYIFQLEERIADLEKQ